MMTARIIGFCLLVMIAVSGADVAGAQDTAAEQPTPDDPMTQLIGTVKSLSEQVAALSGQVDAMQQELGALKSQQQPASADELTPVPDLTPESPSGPVTREEFEALKTVVQEQYAGLDSLVRKQEETIAAIESQNVAQEQMLAAISTPDSSGRHIPNVRAIMQDPAGKAAMDEAVHAVMRRQGTVRVANRMNVGYDLLVNRARYYIPANSTKEVSVPVGSVTTELVGYESPKNWTVAAPDYVQDVIIGPRAERSFVPQSPAVETVYYDAFWGWYVWP
jgi:hypothetical protein